jgi:ribonuclease HI
MSGSWWLNPSKIISLTDRLPPGRQYPASRVAVGFGGVTETTAYTDGACIGNPGPGGWAWAIPGGRWANGAAPLTTNQRMELQAVLSAVRAIDGPLEIVPDSTYVVNCFRDRWWEGWIARGWKNKARKDVANRDIWEPLIDEYRRDPQRLQFRWVKGHANDPMNDLVDRLAVQAARLQVDGSGEDPPADVGEADVPAAFGVDPRVPAGRRLVVVGHKPAQLGGYDADAGALRLKLGSILAAKREVTPDLVVMTGMGLGAEQVGAEAAASADVPYVAVLAYPDMDSKWPSSSRARFQSLLADADGVVLLQARQPETKQQAGAALARRDAWLARHTDEALAVWDGNDPLVGRTVRSLRDRVGEEEVWVVDPNEL